MQQIPVPKTLDVEVVERQLAALWKETAGESDDDAAVLRARVANLLVFVSHESLLQEVDALMLDLTMVHPSRALIMLGETDKSDQDIEMFVTSLCQTDKRTGAKRLCGEVVILKARGKFTVELPSASLPLLVPDLTTFLWWRNELRVSDKVFSALINGSDRLVIDSDEFRNPLQDLLEVDRLFGSDQEVGVSDLNWARLTLWRGLLADFYDVPAYQPLLDDIDFVRIDYVSPAVEPGTVAPQALLMAGWLASRLEWTVASEPTTQDNNKTLSFKLLRKDRGSSVSMNDGADRGSSPTVRGGARSKEITLELNRVERGKHKPGRLVEVELRTSASQPASFSVKRSADNLHILAEANIGTDIHRGRVLPVRNRSLAQLLSREMEILSNDNLYQQALAVAAKLIDLSTSSHPDRP
ncbi:MAG TPA: glucose-6-phosphate dehydrogenase assembly protein OpcA [Pyrinomonadaceae bacterium]|nr:glucose-6-phosphate dehydrogenase assembly protein OpcA [Pyrinomonadaceae bacterium]